MKYFICLLCIMSTANSTLGASDFWNGKKPADWSAGEIQYFLIKSSWVHYFGHILVPSDVVSGFDKQGHRRIALVPAGDIVIRWESATLVRDALARIESKEYNDALAGFSKDYYIIAVIHISKGTGQAGLSSHWSREQEEELRNTSAAQAGQHGTSSQSILMRTPQYAQARRVFLSSLMLRPGYEAISPARAESGENAEGRVDLLMFTRDIALEKNEGDIGVTTTFWVGMGRSTVTVKFSMKELMQGPEPGL